MKPEDPGAQGIRDLHFIAHREIQLHTPEFDEYFEMSWRFLS